MSSPGERESSPPFSVRQAMPPITRITETIVFTPGNFLLRTAPMRMTQRTAIFSRKAAEEAGIMVRLTSSQAMQVKRARPVRNPPLISSRPILSSFL